VRRWAYEFTVLPLLLLAGFAFSYRLLNIPSRMETTLFWIVFFLIPTLKYPKLGVYYLFCLPLFIPLFRRMYYLVSERPALDYLMLISDGVMAGLIMAIALLWIMNKERSGDVFSALITAYFLLLLVKVFAGSQVGVLEGLYGFKFNGLYVFFFFAGSYILTTFDETRKVLGWSSWMLLITALYGMKQILFGFAAFEQKWLDSITFTTLRIEGVVRPFSTYASPAALSDGMTILFLIGAYLMFSRGRNLFLFGALIAVAAVPPLLIATVRTNWMALLAGIFFYAVFLRLNHKWVKFGVVAAMVAGLAAYALKEDAPSEGSVTHTAVLAAQSGKNERGLTDVMIKNRTSALVNPLKEYSVQKRIDTWKGILITSWYFPLGKGQNTTGYAHSYYLQVLGEIGYPGLILFLSILAMGLYRGMKVIRHSRDKDLAEFARLLVTIIFVISILNLTGTHLHTPPGDVFFWFSLGCISRFYRRMQAERQATPAGRDGNPGSLPETANEGVSFPGRAFA